MFQVCSNLFIGDEKDCFFDEKDDWAVIHACKSPCHQRALGYEGSLPENHPHYLFYLRGNHLFLNMIDPPKPFFKQRLFVEALNFMEKHISERRVLVHCNEGLSRAPSIVLLFLSKRAKITDDKSYREATYDFMKIFPGYKPGKGIETYLGQQWEDLR